MRRLFTLRASVAALAALASQALLAAGLAMAGRVDGAVGAAACALGWLAALALAAPVASALLAASLALDVLAVLAGAPGWLAATAAAASLAAWDLTQLASGRARGVDGAAERRVVVSHLRGLAAGVLPGLALAAILGQVRLTVPFPLMVGLVIVALVALDRAARRVG